MDNIKNSYVLVTGAYGGLGKAVVKILLSSGFKVFATDITVGEASENFIPIAMNVTKDDDIKNAVNRVSEYTDCLYAVINLAGVFYMDSIVEGDEEKLRRIIEINFFGTYKVNKAFTPLLRRGSRIINITSELVEYSPQPFMGCYTISKGMLDIYTDVLRRELNYLGVKVIKIHSGSFKTKMLGNAGSEYDVLIAKTKLYKSQLSKMKFMMDKELKKNNSPDKFAKKIIRVLKKRNPKLCYKINRSAALRFLSILPESWQDKIYMSYIK